jgi:GMP synthase-like glutamine amidotransferase
MMKALVIQHDHVSPTGPVGRRLEHHGFDVTEFLVVPAESFQNPNIEVNFPDVSDFDLLVPLGAPWGAWDDRCIGNWLQPELDLVRTAVLSNQPVLGICFGGQLIARALGAHVGPAPREEIGWTSIWSDLPELISNGPWFQFHYDRFDVPEGAIEIARNPAAPQAFTINKTLAVQFHPEIEATGLKGWLDWGGDKKVEEAGLDPVIMLEQTRAEQGQAEQRTYDLIDEYLKSVAGLI